jgi:hypothetical protein
MKPPSDQRRTHASAGAAAVALVALALSACVAPISARGRSDQLDVRAYHRLCPAKALATALENGPQVRMALGWSSGLSDQTSANSQALGECEAARREMGIQAPCRIFLVGDALNGPTPTPR